MSQEQVAAVYREALRRLADPEGASAVARLQVLEKSVTGDAHTGALRALRRAEDEVIASLGSGADALLPVIYLHFLADPVYLQAGDVWLAAQNRVRVTELVQRYAERAGTPAARQLGAQILAALGSTPAALELDPDNELALLRTGMMWQKSSRPDLATEALRHLLGAHPGSRHAELRLAVALRRSGDTDRARTMFEQLGAATDAPRWVRGLAFQELAEIEREEGHEAQAEGVLKRGIEALGTQALYLQLAFYLDRALHSDQAVALLNRMQLGEGAGEPAPRDVFNGPPVAETAAAVSELEAAVQGSLGTLRAALVAGGGAQGASR